MSKKAPSWFSYVNTIISTIGTGQFTGLEDQKTYNVMRKVISGLMSKSGIDGSLLHAFITNIRVRADARNFTATGPVVLTRSQQTHARSKGWNTLPALASLRERNAPAGNAECVRNDDDLVDAIPLLFRIHSALNPQSFRAHSAKMPRKLAEELEFWWLNEMKRNEMNHEPDVIAASPQFHEEARTPSVIPSDVHDGTEPPSMPEHEQEKVVQSKGPRGTRPQISIWVKETKGKLTATGNLEMGGQMYRLVFGDYDWTMERLLGEGFDNDDYRKMLNDEVYPAFRATQGSRELSGMFQMSAIYDLGDSYARKPPVASEMCIALDWSGDNQLVGAVIIEGNAARRAEIKKYGNGLHKGAF